MRPRPGPLLLPGPSGTSPDLEGSWHCGIHVELKPLNCTVGVLAPGPEGNDQSSSLYLTGASCVKLSTGESDLIWVRALPPTGSNKRSWEVDIMRKCDLHRETQACLSPEFSCEPVFRKGLGEKARGSGIRRKQRYESPLWLPHFPSDRPRDQRESCALLQATQRGLALRPPLVRGPCPGPAAECRPCCRAYSPSDVFYPTLALSSLDLVPGPNSASELVPRATGGRNEKPFPGTRSWLTIKGHKLV